MKSIILLFVLSLNFFSFAQTESEKIKAYKVIVITESERIEGFLHSADTSKLNVLEDVKDREPNLITVKNTDIRRIKIGKKGRVVRGTLIGASIGGTLGFIVGYADGDDQGGFFSLSKEEKGLISGITLGLIGGGVGAIIGTGKKKIDIDFNVTKYLNSLSEIKNYAIIKND
ncbi:hypothetical protein [Winogradskyella sp. A3E31]|uniref:hypothetical protein n=1 Tax=Winogradskyella sp. A3E31 TaxID=3349637 RepID=UPI00398B6F81